MATAAVIGGRSTNAVVAKAAANVIVAAAAVAASAEVGAGAAALVAAAGTEIGTARRSASSGRGASRRRAIGRAAAPRAGERHCGATVAQATRRPRQGSQPLPQRGNDVRLERGRITRRRRAERATPGVPLVTDAVVAGHLAAFTAG